eukprot:2146258-Rhodomonas_salina.3
MLFIRPDRYWRTHRQAAYVLRASYAMSGTDAASGPTPPPVLTPDILVPARVCVRQDALRTRGRNGG